ncbi:centromere protein H (CENP-H)-domain-containing protein [Halenospora varia]|nr:centromere protein H (CENP-H)-domain-containing protein [Halenospora varia]
MEGVEVTRHENATPPLLSEQEKRILEVYDRMEELQLEIALLKAQGVLSQDEPMHVSEEDIKTAQQDLLKAKAAYQLRSNIVENVLATNPILKAVHSGNNATSAEQDLLPLIEKRDELSTRLTGLTSQILSTKNELTTIEREHITRARKNTDLAKKMIALAEEANTRKRDDISSKAREKLQEMEESVKTSRQRWRIMKGTASGTIVGSGVDWARDPKLLEIVLDHDGTED